MRDSTNIGHSAALDSQNSANTRDSAFRTFGDESSQATYKLNTVSYSYLDTPSSTSSLTYKLTVRTWSSTTFRLNRPLKVLVMQLGHNGWNFINYSNGGGSLMSILYNLIKRIF